ncbi:MAG: 3-oxoacyl-ACP reductase [Chloroflexi bacterium RBG_16_50_9]|nr:MAG: 3-oxoacyl-ACP reductase [Chloroflexi bacterium RBG_16_50_9]
MKEFKGKVAVITGAASGIGFGLAERCAKEGMKVVLADVNEDTLQKAETDIKKTGATTLVVKTDVSRAEDVKTLAEKTLDTFGAVHLLFNNAGVGTFATSVWESTLADWQWVLGVNLWGVIYGVHFFIPIMLKQGVECHIVNTASTSGLVTNPYSSPYAVSKHGVVILSETLYHELAQKTRNIGVSVLIPGYVKTKVMDAERNRPSELKNKPGEGIDLTDPSVQGMMQSYKQGFETGMLPEKVADIVFKAIREKKFYILPNAEFVKSLIRTRMEDILHERNPKISR